MRLVYAVGDTERVNIVYRLKLKVRVRHQLVIGSIGHDCYCILKVCCMQSLVPSACRSISSPCSLLHIPFLRQMSCWLLLCQAIQLLLTIGNPAIHLGKNMRDILQQRGTRLAAIFCFLYTVHDCPILVVLVAIDATICRTISIAYCACYN